MARDMKNVPYDDMYKTLTEQHSKTKVDFVMYDMFGYDNPNFHEQENKKEIMFKKDVYARYDNKCVISETDRPCQVCYIVPLEDCTEREKYDVNNGIVLRDDIYQLFNNKEIKINPDTLRVELSDNIKHSINKVMYHRFNGMCVNINKNSLPYLRKIYD